MFKKYKLVIVLGNNLEVLFILRKHKMNEPVRTSYLDIVKRNLRAADRVIRIKCSSYLSL